MKKRYLVPFILLIGFTIFVWGYSEDSENVTNKLEKAIMTDSFNRILNGVLRTTNTGNNIYSIDDILISREDFNGLFSLYLTKLSDDERSKITDIGVIKKKFLEYTVGQYMIALEAMDDTNFNTTPMSVILKAAVLQTVYEDYLKFYAPKDMSIFMPSEDEINDYYQNSLSQKEKDSMTYKEVRNKAISVLSSIKVQKWAADFIDEKRKNHIILNLSNEDNLK